MKIPKYIEEALQRRVRAATAFNEADWIISTWLAKNGIDCEDFDTYGGVESIVNPVSSANRIRECILNHGK